MEIGIDVIGDLFLSPDDEFNWDGKSTSLYCIVTGNISNDIGKLDETLTQIAESYKGVFYVSGSYEFENCPDIRSRVDEINLICKANNVASLWHHVVVLENTAILGCNGYTNDESFLPHQKRFVDELYYEDLAYIKKSISKLQKHGDVKNIIMVTNSVPKQELYYGQVPDNYKQKKTLDFCLDFDTEKKITNWAFGSYGKAVDTEINGIRYLNNPYFFNQPYWPKRIKTYI